MSTEWRDDLLNQLVWHWDNQLRPRLDGLSDDEYFWRPVPGTWTVRSIDEGRDGVLGLGPGVIEFEIPVPDPEPVTTIAWRMGHIIAGVFGERNARYFGGPAMNHREYSYPLSAAEALAELDAGQARWRAGVESLTDEDLRLNCREPGFETDSMAAMVIHIHREVIHHGAEIALLRDLYLRRDQLGR